MFIIGERINPSGKPELSRAIREQEGSFIQGEALAQERAGAQALDINVRLRGVDPVQAIQFVVRSVREVSRLPLALDDQDPGVVEAGLRGADARALINSPLSTRWGAREERITSTAERFGLTLVILPTNGGEVGRDLKSRVQTAQRIIARLQAGGIRRERIVMDAILLALKQVRGKVSETLEAIQRFKGELGVQTVIGLSNLSYGLRRREELNAKFLRLAKSCGLDYVICDPLQEAVMRAAEEPLDGGADFLQEGMVELLAFAQTC